MHRWAAWEPQPGSSWLEGKRATHEMLQCGGLTRAKIKQCALYMAISH